MPGASESCPAFCYAAVAFETSGQVVGIASGIVSGETLTIFYFHLSDDSWGRGLETQFLSRLERWGRKRGAAKARWLAARPAERVFACSCGYRLQESVCVKSLETAAIRIFEDCLPPVWEAGGICLLSRELDRPDTVAKDDGLPLNGIFSFDEGFSFGEVSPGGEGLPRLWRSEVVAAVEQGKFRPVVYYAVTACTPTEEVGSAKGVVSCDMLLICSLRVSREFRGHGLGTELLGRFEDLGRELGARQAWQRPDEAVAREFALKCGYRPKGQYCYTKPLEAHVLGAKSLKSFPDATWEPREGIVFEALRLLFFVPTWRGWRRIGATGGMGAAFRPHTFVRGGGGGGAGVLGIRRRPGKALCFLGASWSRCRAGRG